MKAAQKPWVTVFCGFLGVGKTTLLRQLLAQAGTAGEAGGRAKWAAVVNDVAAVNIDGAVVRAASEADEAAGLAGAEEIVELGNGCVCCSGSDDLGEAIARLAASGRYEHIFVETSGVAEPRGVAGLFTRKSPFGKSLADLVVPAAMVTVVDVVALASSAKASEAKAARAVPGSGERPVFELMLEQIECADVVILNQCDRATQAGDELARAEAWVSGLNARAEIVRTERGQVAAEFFTGRVRFDPVATAGAARWIRELNRQPEIPNPKRSDPKEMPEGTARRGWAVRPVGGAAAYHESKYGITSCVYRARVPFDQGRLRVAFAEGLSGVLRAKGFFWTKAQPDEMGYLSLAGGVVRWETLSVWWAARVENGRASKADVPPAVAAVWQEPWGDRRQEIVLIGVGVAAREAELRAQLDVCLEG
jgi:G3E family GTPase